ncbi:MAG TPA: hypothetical protein VFM43_03035 [Gaiellaceae bacterium]|nr:hypothetical protein [Gaiellaceae bacterium]
MANLEWERVGEPAVPAVPPLRPHSAVDWITEHQEAAVERLFVLLEQNQAAIAALAQAWRHTRRALELTQAELANTQNELAAERRASRHT